VSVQAPATWRVETNASAPARDPFLDNVKFLAIVLVVIGHAWTELRASQTVEAAYLFLFLFHMPVFVVLTGFVTRTDNLTPHRVQRLAVAVGVPYVVFSLAYRPVMDLGDGEPVHFDIVDPPWLMWFLMALLIWRLTAPVWQGMKGALAAAVLISLVGGVTSEPDFGLARVLGFLPFFVLGIRLRREHLDRLHTRPIQIASVLAFLLTAVVCFVVVPYVRLEWTYWRSSYAELEVNFLAGAAVRLGLIVAGVLLTVAFLALVPRRALPFSRLGEYTMYAYLLHGFVIEAATWIGVPEIDGMASWRGGAITALAAALLTVLLMTPPMRTVFRPVVEPDLSRLWHHRR
jgi:fucose 4-O-acetylase-like acetyltransferase